MALYTGLKFIPGTDYSGILTFVVSMIFGVLVLIYSTWLWHHAAQESKAIFGYLALSFWCIFILDVICHIIFNVLNMKHSEISNLLLSSYNIPYLGFLFFQFMAWCTFLAKNFTAKKRKDIFLYLPVVI